MGKIEEKKCESAPILNKQGGAYAYNCNSSCNTTIRRHETVYMGRYGELLPVVREQSHSVDSAKIKTRSATGSAI